MQYHPEIGLDEVAVALRRQCDDLISAGLARSCDDVEGYACQIDALHGDPSRRDIAWRLGLDEEVSDPKRRRTELRNFVERLALSQRSARAMT